MSEKIGMEFLGLFSGKKKEPEKPKVVKPELTQDVLDDIFITANVIRNQNKKKKASVMKFSKGAELTDSKVGGIPFMTAKTEIPMCDNRRNQMLMLCQINCADIPAGLGFPTAGLYQIWVDPEEAFEGYYESGNGCFKFIYYNVIDEEKNGLSIEEIKERYNPKTDDTVQINGEFKITFGNVVVDNPSIYDPTVYSKFVNKIQKKYLKEDPGYEIEDVSGILNEVFDNISDYYDAQEAYEDKFLIPDAKICKVGGYIPCTYEPNPDDTTFPQYESNISDLNLVLCYFDLKNKELFKISDVNDSKAVYWGITAKNFKEAENGRFYCPSQVVWTR